MALRRLRAEENSPLDTTRKSVHTGPGFPFVKARGHSTKRPFVGSEETPWLWATSGGLLGGLDSGFMALGFFHLTQDPALAPYLSSPKKRKREKRQRDWNEECGEAEYILLTHHRFFSSYVTLNFSSYCMELFWAGLPYPMGKWVFPCVT